MIKFLFLGHQETCFVLLLKLNDFRNGLYICRDIAKQLLNVFGGFRVQLYGPCAKSSAVSARRGLDTVKAVLTNDTSARGNVPGPCLPLVANVTMKPNWWGH